MGEAQRRDDLGRPAQSSDAQMQIQVHPQGIVQLTVRRKFDLHPVEIFLPFQQVYEIFYGVLTVQRDAIQQAQGAAGATVVRPVLEVSGVDKVHG